MDVPKYAPLTEYLVDLPPEVTTVTLTFEQLGAIVGRRLPASAWGRSWWGNTPNMALGRAWLGAGWWLVAVSVRGGGEAVTFERHADVAP